MKQIISLSGGIGSWCCLDRILQESGLESVDCVFCDTLSEDGDLYRFLEDIEKYYSIRITRLCSGETPFSLAWKEKFIFNSRVAKCSSELKSKPFRKWLEDSYDPSDATVCLGIDWTESHRCKAIEKNYKPFEVRFPLCEPPYLSKQDMIAMLAKTGIKPPRAYEMGFAHNNCKGCCFKAGIGHYVHLLETDPVAFLEMENREEALRQRIGKDVAILKRNGKPYTLKQLRKEKKQITLEESMEIGGCGCFAE
jgi:3'-phosphoadenosine 5'-phosphosulfate sulfotransferase (PAPS reductase)/FAD synthetase